jgi:hypothetical protein
MIVRERFEAVQVPHRVAGTTARASQVVRNDCKISVVYDVREATGSAFLIQSQVVHLRLRVPKSGTAYRVECLWLQSSPRPRRKSRLRRKTYEAGGDTR